MSNNARSDEHPQRVTPLAFRRLVQALEEGWDQQCGGQRNPATCEICAAYQDILDTVRRDLAPRD